eukprot:TRINITY_DN18867_c0_g1_i1.p1 TRINITY_DN18867_c0_g1~~TRINITY_DN18867_c0_g1_i1.p1  ORF type:complete len:531 (-),score=90.12 TRINITY_DN18867_c0_g1_i1:56-1648(-)
MGACSTRSAAYAPGGSKASGGGSQSSTKPASPALNSDDEMPGSPSGKLVGHSLLIRELDGAVQESYTFTAQPIGCGGFGKVYRAVHKATQSVRAVKCMSTTKLKRAVDQFRQEIAIMKLMNHPNIVKLFEVFEDREHIYLVMEICLGGCLMDHLRRGDQGEHHLEESCGRKVMRQVFYAINYMHRNKICHRDIKPENFLLLTRDPLDQTILKVGDFGFARRFQEGEDLTTKVGTLHYSSPEVLFGRYDKSSDLWSCGVIMFLILCGRLPFEGQRDSEVVARVRRGNYSLSGGTWDVVSEDAKDMIRKLLRFDRFERCTAAETMQHEWIDQRQVGTFGTYTRGAMVLSLTDQVRSFFLQHSVKQVARHVIAQQLNEAQLREIRDCFMSLDTDHDSLLTKKELRNGLSDAGIAEPLDLSQILEVCPIDYTEFLALTLDLNLYLDGSACESAFAALDTDGDGRITRADLEGLLGKSNRTSSTLKAALQEMQKDLDSGTKEVDFPAFMQIMHDQSMGVTVTLTESIARLSKRGI